MGAGGWAGGCRGVGGWVQGGGVQGGCARAWQWGDVNGMPCARALNPRPPPPHPPRARTRPHAHPCATDKDPPQRTYSFFLLTDDVAAANSSRGNKTLLLRVSPSPP